MDFAGLFIASPSADGSPVFKSSTASSFCIASTGILAAFFGRLELSFVVIRRAQCGPPYIKGLRCALFQMSSISGFVKCAAPIQWGRLWKSRLGEAITGSTQTPCCLASRHSAPYPSALQQVSSPAQCVQRVRL